MFIKVGKTDIYYEFYGNPKNPAVMLMHSLGFSCKVFKYLVPILKNDFFMILPDIRGHGKSTGEERETTLWEIVDEMIELLEKVKGIFKFQKLLALGGISMGGMIAMRMVLREENIADYLLLMGTSGDEEEGKEKYLPLIENMKNAKKDELPQMRDQAADVVLRLCFHPSFLTEERYKEWFEVVRQSGGDSLAGVYVSEAVIKRDSILDKLEKIKQKTLILVGENDYPLPPRHSENLYKRIKNSKIFVIPGAGHLITIEKPEEVGRIILDFLKGGDKL